MPLILPGNVGSATAATGYNVANSLRFDDGSSEYLSNTSVSTVTNRLKFTISLWVKRSTLGAKSMIGTVGGDSTNFGAIWFDSSDRLNCTEGSGGGTLNFITNRVFRDVSAWYNIILAIDTTQGTESNRVKIYVNGTQETSFSTSTYPGQNSNMHLNRNGKTQYIGRHTDSSNDYYFDGYMTEVVWVDGQQLDQTSFGEFDSDSPTIWKPIDVSSLTFGNNGFYLDFENKGKIHTLTANGNVHHETDQAKFGNSSIYFDGNGDYIGINDIDQFTFPGDFTVEFFARMGDQADNYTTLFDDANHRFRVNLGSASTSAPKLTFYSTVTDAHTSGTSDIGDNAWHHCAIVRDNGTLRIFVDGTQENTRASSGGLIDVSGAFEIGRYDELASLQYAGYLDEIRISSIARYTSNFTPTTSAFADDEHTRLLIHSDAADGNTSFVDSSGVAGGIGNDVSGNNNDFVSTNINTIVDQSTDTCTNNAITMNPLDDIASSTYSEANLKVVTSASGSPPHFTTFGVTTGKWYWEVKATSFTEHSAGYICIGITANQGNSTTNQLGHLSGDYAFINNGNLQAGTGNDTSYGNTYTQGQIIGTYLDLDNNKLYFSINGSLQNSGTGHSILASSATTVGFYMPSFSDYSSSSSNLVTVEWNFGAGTTFAISSGNSDDNGYGNFEYSPNITGDGAAKKFYTLNTKNLAEYG